jgi:hypothetical protein
MTVIEIDEARALELLREVVAEAGEDFVYKINLDPDATCLYVKGGCPDCMIARALAKAGATIKQLESFDSLNESRDTSIDTVAPRADWLQLTDEALKVFTVAQQNQDTCETWGDALRAAENWRDSEL